MKLKVEFDHNHGESMYSSDKSKQAIQRFRDEDLVKDKMMAGKLLILMRKIVTIVKSDGTSLYVTRDIASALVRRESLGLKS